MFGVMKKYRHINLPLTLITVLLVLLIAGLAGAALTLLRGMHDRAAHTIAARAVLDHGRQITAHLTALTLLTDKRPDLQGGKPFSRVVRSMNAIEHGLQYVSVVDDGVVLFHEQSSALDGSELPADIPPFDDSDYDIEMTRKMLQVGPELVPVVVFKSRSITDEKKNRFVEVALRLDTVREEGVATGQAIASMFRVSLITIVVSFGCCVLLVAWMMRREILRERIRREQEHLAFSGVLANGIVHDFRNPMSSMRLDVQMIRKETAKGNDCRGNRLEELAERVQGTIDRMDKVFQEFLYVARPDSDTRENVNLKMCIQDCLLMLAPRLEHAGITAEVSAPDGTVCAHVYEASLRRAFVNIITNAEQFSSTGQKIRIEISKSGGKAIVNIIDNGPGISKEKHKNIFDMFVSSRPGGTGLGLFLAKTAIETSNGTISAKNADHGGTCIRIVLPGTKKQESFK